MTSLAQLLFLSSQNLYDLDEDDDIVAPVPTKQMKFAATGSLVHHMVWRFFLSLAALCTSDQGAG